MSGREFVVAGGRLRRAAVLVVVALAVAGLLAGVADAASWSSGVVR